MHGIGTGNSLGSMVELKTENAEVGKENVDPSEEQEVMEVDESVEVKVFTVESKKRNVAPCYKPVH